MLITIKNNNVSATIDTMGAQLISLKDNKNTEYIWQRNPDIWKNCSPILFPIVGNCRNNKTIINGCAYEIPKHGPCKTTEFHMKAITESTASFEITEKDFPTDCYPYPFHLIVHYTLQNQTLDLTLELSNSSEKPIFYCIGLHPGICCPLHEGETFEDYILRFGRKQNFGYRRYDTKKQEFDMSHEYPFPGNQIEIPLSRELFLHDAIWFDRLSSKELSLINPKTGHGLATFFPDFETVAFWTSLSKNAHYICIESWNGSAICSDEDNEFLHKNHLQKLNPDDSKKYTMQFCIL